MPQMVTKAGGGGAYFFFSESTSKIRKEFGKILSVTVLIIPLIVVAERYCCLLGAP